MSFIIYQKREEVARVEFKELQNVREWIMSNLDTSLSTTVRECVDGRERFYHQGIKYNLYRIDSGSMSVSTCDRVRTKKGWFTTKGEAQKDYDRGLKEANTKLDIIEDKLLDLQRELGFDLGYIMDGDTHGIYEDYQYIEVQLNGYHYIRRLES